jgi:hypothetical protein
LLRAVEVELSASAPAVPRLRRLFEEALSRFGESSVDLWLKYAIFELQHGDLANARYGAAGRWEFKWMATVPTDVVGGVAAVAAVVFWPPG